MEVSGTVIRQSVISFTRGVGETFPFSDKSRARARQRTAVVVRPWSDDRHRLYYSSPVRCGASRDAKRKEEKKRTALVTELSRNLAALYSTSLGMDGEEISGDVRANMIIEAAELLSAQLNQQKAKEKEMKKRMKAEKEAMKAAKMRNCAEMSSSSSSSSESSDSECEELMVSNKPKKHLQEEIKTNILCLPHQPSPIVEADEKTELNYTELKMESELNSSNCMKSAVAVVSCSDIITAATKPLDKIEVCMGGKCKKSGAMDLLQEFEKKVGKEGAVVGCKCMGKCKEGPNVRIVTHCGSKDELLEVSKKPLCIGVGLEDVGAIVANFLGDNNVDLGFLAA
ncbi:diacylglycerol O-acyltransferase 3, cytosolic [Phalaenopsis equestris]|uniref:diacylglycerol O-acyltransferase 3, cytosolic n=1 Tax=Phalaenopsis equestris TaxID=78828 RepID=UPI0009E36AC5|nr:diacylglycerol O-acyltransferase 3, cytosolic [Phalaenopsis equestris]